jgi:hypothetical protein
VPCISCIFSWYAGRLLAKSRDGVGHGRLVRRQSGDRSPRSGLHVLRSGAPHCAPASNSCAHQRAEDLRRSERSAVHEEARVQEHLGAYRCLSDEYPQQIVPWCPSSRSGAHVRRRAPRGRPRGTAAASIGPHARVDPGARRRPWRLHGFPAYNGPRRNPSKAVGRRDRTPGRPDGVVSLARCAPSVHAPWAWRMTSRPSAREAKQAPALGSAQAPQHGWASRSRATHLRCLEAWRPVAAGRNARRQ